MTAFDRFFLRLRRRAAHWYELLLYGLLLALALGTALAASPAGDDTQCGNIHSNPSVITR